MPKINLRNPNPEIASMSVHIEFHVTAPPFRWDEAGGIRIGNSRVTLDSLLATYHNGSTPKEIAVQYPVLLKGVLHQTEKRCMFW